MPTKRSREELTSLIVQLAKLPPGSDTDGYFSKEQMEQLAIKLSEMTAHIDRMAGHIANLTGKLLDPENEKIENDIIRSSESEGL